YIRYWRDPRVEFSGSRIVRVLILLLVFLYVMLVWSSSVQPALRGISIFGMFIVNMILLYHLILARLVRPYHNALTALTQKPGESEVFQQVWRSGKRFYYARYTWSSLFSGANPFHFLGQIATDRVRDDIRDTLRRYGVEQKMLSLASLVAYLKQQIGCDQTMPADFRDLILQAIDGFANHPYIQEKANEFLGLASERPEEINFPEWKAQFESCIKSTK
ncbi:MAG: hypothetical protein WA228_01760, partial [Desulfobaccales bacterium]